MHLYWLLVSSLASAAAALPSSGTESARGKFKWLGVSESSAEWGTAMPGTAGKDYTFPSTATIDVRTQTLGSSKECLNRIDAYC